MPDLDRARKTEEKTRRGGLPAPTMDYPKAAIGDGSPCDGCGETIDPRERSNQVNVRGVLLLRFHVDCYVTWIHVPRDKAP
jgi:hypothetical protein